MQTNVLAEQPVRLAGDVDDHDLQLLRKAVLGALQTAGADTDAVIDLSDVATLSSNAMDLLRRASTLLRAEGRRLVIISSKRPIARALDFDAVYACMEAAAPPPHLFSKLGEGQAGEGSAARTTHSLAHDHTRGTERNPADAEAGTEAWYFEKSLLF